MVATAPVPGWTDLGLRVVRWPRHSEVGDARPRDRFDGFHRKRARACARASAATRSCGSAGARRRRRPYLGSRCGNDLRWRARRRRRRRAPRGRGDRREEVDAGAEGTNRRLPRQGNGAARAGAGRAATRNRPCSSRAPRSATTERTVATRCSTSRAAAATTSWPVCAGSGRLPPQPAAGGGIRLVTIRTGIVLEPSGGVLEADGAALPPRSRGSGGRRSPVDELDRARPTSWEQSSTRSITTSLRGPVNLTAPNPGDERRAHEGARPRSPPADGAADAASPAQAALRRRARRHVARRRTTGAAAPAASRGLPVRAHRPRTGAERDARDRRERLRRADAGRRKPAGIARG